MPRRPDGLQQAREFDKALDLDGVIMTKLDGTAKGGIAVAVSHELGLPIPARGRGRGYRGPAALCAREYAEALFGEMRAELDGDEEGGDLSTSVSDDTSGRDDMPEPEEAPSVISSEEPEATPSVISSEESEANEVEKSQPSSSPDDGDLSGLGV